MSDLNERAGAVLRKLEEVGAIPSRWRGGMLVCAGMQGSRRTQRLVRDLRPDAFWFPWVLGEHPLPITSDTLTRRALLDVIREVTGELLVYLYPCEHDDGRVTWAVLAPKVVSKANLWVHHALAGSFGTREAEALVNALEAIVVALAALADRTSDGSVSAEGVARETEPETTKETS